MKAIFESAIKRGGYDLADMLAKIDSYHIEGKISDAERDELYALARKSPEAQYEIKAEIERLWAAIKELKNTSSDSTETAVNEWKQPTGAHDAYMKGNIVVFEGKTYKSIIDYNVWSPSVYPAGWEKQ
jgi:hypothetical protein